MREVNPVECTFRSRCVRRRPAICHVDPTTRRVELPSGRTILLSDTVGFIQKLPVTLVAAFRATLEEVVEADLLLHVVDAATRAWDHADVVEDTLAELEASGFQGLSVEEDRRGDAVQDLDFSELGYRQVIRTSATAGTGLDELPQPSNRS